MKDYIKIEYAKGGNLYILATQLEMIQKYAGSDAKKPKLNRLGGSEWTRTKSKVRGVVQEVAKDLVKLYAARQEKDGYVYGPDTVWQTEFEELFPFEETEDQQLAIEAAKRDMESTKIMDRLICGDVGYGKTEIAIRAAFKAVQENKQVVYLVPTTILAQQHYNTFVQRMKDFPVRIDLMSRFRTPAEIKKTVTDLKKGFVDIVIGTHRVLSSDVEFKDLGLLIIDEEQRFGVAHKEKIKKLKENVDVLTLTATPIPRTLHMSLIGIRDMSVLEEAPQDRLPIQTYVMEYDSEMVRAAISRELARGGQVYYVYNRVNNIAEVAAQVADLVPEANVAYAHGQMREHELERIMFDFISGEIDVLVSTTIIETGLDISNANTMIIHDADNLGLSQLYQLRGRVGRSNRTSYAFLMYRRDKLLKEVAEKRLGAIRERAANFMKTNTEEVLREAGADAETVERYLTRNELASRTAQAIQDAFEPGLTEEDARVGRLTYALFSVTGTYDAEGNHTAFTEEEIAQIQKDAEAFAARARELGDITAAGGELNHTVIDVYFGDDTNGGAHPQVAEAARALKPGGVSDVIRTEDGWYVVQHVTDYDEKATQENLEALTEDARQQHLLELEDAWEKETPLTLEESVWGTVQVKGSEE